MRYETHFNCFKLLGALPFSETRANALLPVIALAERHEVTGFDSQGQGVLPAPHGTHLRIQFFFSSFFMYALEVAQSSQAEPVMKCRLFLSQEAVSFAPCIA